MLHVYSQYYNVACSSYSYNSLSAVQQLGDTGSCLESSLFGNKQYRFADLRISVSANDMSKYLSFANGDFFDLRYEKETLLICILSTEVIQGIVGDVKEAVIQEVGVVNPNDLCPEYQSLGTDSYALMFGSKGILPLSPTGKGIPWRK